MSRYQPYPEYKDSGVEWLEAVPKHWETIAIGRLFHRVKRTNQTGQELLSVYRDYGVIPKSSRDDNNNKPSDDLSPYQLVQIYDLVMNKMKTWQGSIAISEYKGIVSPAYFVYQPLKKLFKVAHPKYVHYLLRNPMYIAQYLRKSKGIRINQWDLDPEEFQKIELLLPTKNEQNNIFLFLDHETAKIDTLIEKQQRLIELLKEKRQAVISHAVTKGLNPNVKMKDSGVEWLGKVPEHWEVKKIKHILKRIESGTSVNAADLPASESELGVLKTSCVYTGEFNPNENKTVVSKEHSKVSCPLKLDTLIVSRMNTPELVGAAGLVRSTPKNIYLPDRLWQVSFIETVPAFIHYLTMTSIYRSYIHTVCAGTSSSMQNLSQDDFKDFAFSLPARGEQKAIVNHLDTQTIKIDTLIEKANQTINLLKERRTALISAAVTGKINITKEIN